MRSESGSKGTAVRAAKSGETARVLMRRTKQITRRRFPAEEKIRVLLEGIRAELSVAELCRREGIHPTVYYSWLKDFMEAIEARTLKPLSFTLPFSSRNQTGTCQQE